MINQYCINSIHQKWSGVEGGCWVAMVIRPFPLIPVVLRNGPICNLISEGQLDSSPSQHTQNLDNGRRTKMAVFTTNIGLNTRVSFWYQQCRSMYNIYCYEDKTVMGLSYLYNGKSYSDKTVSIKSILLINIAYDCVNELCHPGFRSHTGCLLYSVPNLHLIQCYFTINTITLNKINVPSSL